MRQSVGFVALICVALVAHASQYTAFSLKVAQQRIERAGADWRQSEPEVVSLGGINKVEGFVYDKESGDLVLVGDHESARAALTLDDLVVALRARFRYKEWPLVSIDPISETDRTQMQRVRFEGGIQSSAFGKALFGADYLLKQIAMGLAEPGVSGLKTCWERTVGETGDDARATRYEVASRFWFYPINPHVVVREDVCVVRGLKIGVFTEVLSASFDGRPVENVKAFKLEPADAFARDVSQRFDDLCGAHPVFSKLRGLQELVAVSKALEELDEMPDLEWWLEVFPLATEKTPSETRVLSRTHDSRGRRYKARGGVHLAALAMRLNAGDVYALREAVLSTRPTADSPSWTFICAGWVVPLESTAMTSDDVTPLYQQALFLLQNERDDDAASLCSKAIALSPAWDELYVLRGMALYRAGRWQDALVDFDKAIDLNPHNALAHFWRADVQLERFQPSRALADLEKWVHSSPGIPATDARGLMGWIRAIMGDTAAARREFEEVLRLEPSNRLAQVACGQMDKGSSLDEFTRAVAAETRGAWSSVPDSFVLLASLLRMLSDQRAAAFIGPEFDFSGTCKLVDGDRTVNGLLYRKCLAGATDTIKRVISESAFYIVTRRTVVMKNLVVPPCGRFTNCEFRIRIEDLVRVSRDDTTRRETISSSIDPSLQVGAYDVSDGRLLAFARGDYVLKSIRLDHVYVDLVAMEKLCVLRDGTNGKATQTCYDRGSLLSFSLCSEGEGKLTLLPERSSLIVCPVK